MWSRQLAVERYTQCTCGAGRSAAGSTAHLYTDTSGLWWVHDGHADFYPPLGHSIISATRPKSPISPFFPPSRHPPFRPLVPRGHVRGPFAWLKINTTLSITTTTMGRPKRSAAAEPTGAKKAKTSPDAVKTILDGLDHLQDDDGTRALVSAFVKLPSKKLYPDYYAMIAEPISLAEIGKKHAKGAYADAAALVADFQLMYDNAVKYNDPDSWIVQDAHKLLVHVEEQAAALGLAPAAAPDVAKLCLQVLDEVETHDFPGEGVLAGPFAEDVDPDEYPDYYTVIEHPTSFGSVRRQLRDGLIAPDALVAANLQAFYDATVLIFHNAQQFNDPSSLIHEDAKKLQALFEDKYAALRARLVGDHKPGLKLKLKSPKEPVKLKLSLKAGTPEEPPKKRRGRKPKKLIEEEQRLAALAAAQLKHEDDNDNDNDLDDAAAKDTIDATEVNIMGKSKTTPPSSDVFVRRVALSSSLATVSLVLNTIAGQSQLALSPAQVVKKALFPEVPAITAASFFDYQFEPSGFSTKAYSVALPADASSSVSFRVALHELIYGLKKADLVDGHGMLKGRAEEDFMCSLFVNEEEVETGCEMTEEVDPADGHSKLLGLTYDLKLNYGLNVVTFELRLSPGLSKNLKREPIDQDVDEPAGRHTRNQLQQIKLNWEVEKFTLYVVSYS